MTHAPLDALEVFVTVARAGSVTAGANEAGLTQSTVSSRLASLEKHLGYRLFERTSHGVRLTARGRDLLARVGPAIDAAVSAAAGLPTEAAHPVLLGGPAEFLSAVVLPKLYADSDPVEVRVRFGLADDLLADLRAGGLDIVVSSIPARLPGIESHPVVYEEFVLVMAPGLVGAFGEDPGAVPVLSYADDLPIIRRYWRSVFGRPPSGLRLAATVPDLRVLAELATYGAGMTVLPAYLAAPYLADGRLVDPVHPEVAPLNTLYLARRRQRAGADPAVDTLMARLRSVIEGT